MFDLIWGNVYFCTVYVISRKKYNYIANEFEHEASTFMDLKYFHVFPNEAWYEILERGK